MEKGWKGPRPGGIAPVSGEVSVRLTMPGSGRATVSATQDRPTRAPAFSQVTTSLITDCLRNADGSDAGLGDRFGQAAWRAGVVMTISNSMGVSRP
ncbi:hypothetical protein AB0451_35655, partial [Streptomyces sp. NPDC052000]|uniref:hypothetical protein n=1 Tax=Streptomyces sp. NPDC052000 TaxID=3155676 RepID=UPI00344C3E58